jgi:nucleoside-diphosphate-sugar epimerase
LRGTPTVLLTGSTGFVGRHLAHRLAADGWAVTSLQRSSAPVPGVREILRVPELTADAVSRALAGRRFNRLFHLAAYGVKPDDRDPEPMFRINVDVTRRLVEEAARWPARASVFAGSGSEYDLSGVTKPVAEAHPLEALKLTLCALSSARALAAPLAVARLFGVFGPGEAPHRLLPTLVGRLGRSERVPLSDGSQQRDALHVDDAVEALLSLALALEDTPRQVVANVGSGKPATVRAFAETVAAVLGAPRSLLGFGELTRRPDEATCFAGDPSRLRALTGWEPRLDFDTGIRQAVRALRQAA